MSHNTLKDVYQSTCFMGDSVSDILDEVRSWLDGYCNTRHKRSFYFVDMLYNYDGEVGHSITIYHGEIPE